MSPRPPARRSPAPARPRARARRGRPPRCVARRPRPTPGGGFGFAACSRWAARAPAPARGSRRRAAHGPLRRALRPPRDPRRRFRPAARPRRSGTPARARATPGHARRHTVPLVQRRRLQVLAPGELRGELGGEREIPRPPVGEARSRARRDLRAGLVQAVPLQQVGVGTDQYVARLHGRARGHEPTEPRQQTACPREVPGQHRDVRIHLERPTTEQRRRRELVVRKICSKSRAASFGP